MTELWRFVWPGNPATKKNSPLVLALCKDADGKSRRLVPYLEELRRELHLDLAGRQAAIDFAAGLPEEQQAEALRQLIAEGRLSTLPARLHAHLQAAIEGPEGTQTLVLPSEDYRKALKHVMPKIREAFTETGMAPFGAPDQSLAIEAHFFIGPRQRPDLLSLCEAVSDLLQAAGVIANDSWIASWDGTRRHKDQRDRPRTEVIIREFKASGNGREPLDPQLRLTEASAEERAS